MILDRIENIALYKDIPSLRDAIAYILSQDLAALPIGKTEIHGSALYVSVQSYTSRPASECRDEAHRSYIDLQYILEGEEVMGYRPLSSKDEIAEAAPEGDIWFYEKAAMTPLQVKSGMFAVFYPHDIHSPCQQLNGPSHVKKLVFKIYVEEMS